MKGVRKGCRYRVKVTDQGGEKNVKLWWQQTV